MLVQRCEGEVRGKATLSDHSHVGVARRNTVRVSTRSTAKTRGSLTILSGGGLLPTRHSSLPLECLTACCVASAVMIGGPGLRKKERQQSRKKKKRNNLKY